MADAPKRGSMWGGQRGVDWAEREGREGWVESGWDRQRGGRGGQRGVGFAEELMGREGLRERSDCLAASEASRAVQDRAPRSKAQRSAVQTARI